MTDEKQASGEAVLSSDGLGARTSFAPTVVMPGGGTVTPEGWMWVLGFAMAGCEWAIEAAERDGLQQKAMDYQRRQRIYCYAILDDSNDMLDEQDGNFVHVTGEDGMRLRDFRALCQILDVSYESLTAVNGPFMRYANGEEPM